MLLVAEAVDDNDKEELVGTEVAVEDADVELGESGLEERPEEALALEELDTVEVVVICEAAVLEVLVALLVTRLPLTGFCDAWM